MARVKGRTVTRKHRKGMLKLAKGYCSSRHALFETTKERAMNSYNYAYRDRRQEKHDFRKLWIARINATARMNGLSYSELIHGLKVTKVDTNREMLVDLVVSDAAAFTALADQAKDTLAE